jgi:hypothetical protein
LLDFRFQHAECDGQSPRGHFREGLVVMSNESHVNGCRRVYTVGNQIALVLEIEESSVGAEKVVDASSLFGAHNLRAERKRVLSEFDIPTPYKEGSI